MQHCPFCKKTLYDLPETCPYCGQVIEENIRRTQPRSFGKYRSVSNPSNNRRDNTDILKNTPEDTKANVEHQPAIKTDKEPAPVPSPVQTPPEEETKTEVRKPVYDGKKPDDEMPDIEPEEEKEHTGTKNRDEDAVSYADGSEEDGETDDEKKDTGTGSLKNLISMLTLRPASDRLEDVTISTDLNADGYYDDREPDESDETETMPLRDIVRYCGVAFAIIAFTIFMIFYV